MPKKQGNLKIPENIPFPTLIPCIILSGVIK
jgi:hypothetical protein